MKNYYYILGVHKNASVQEIKSAYRKLAIRLHPDKNAGDRFFEERFKDIKEAYEILSDDIKKAHYDTKLANYYGSSDDNAIKEYSELLKKRYKDELRRREEEIKKRYRDLEQKSKEEAKKRNEAKEAKHNEEKYRILSELEAHKRLIEQKDQTLKVIKQKLSAAEAEISRLRKDAVLAMSKNIKSKSGGLVKESHLSLKDYPEIIKELEKIRELIPRKDVIIFLKMALQYSETRSLSPKYGRDHPQLVKLILKDSVHMKPFKLFYSKHKKDPKMINDLKTALLQYFNLFPI